MSSKKAKPTSPSSDPDAFDRAFKDRFWWTSAGILVIGYCSTFITGCFFLLHNMPITLAKLSGPCAFALTFVLLSVFQEVHAMPYKVLEIGLRFTALILLLTALIALMFYFWLKVNPALISGLSLISLIGCLVALKVLIATFKGEKGETLVRKMYAP